MLLFLMADFRVISLPQLFCNLLQAPLDTQKKEEALQKETQRVQQQQKATEKKALALEKRRQPSLQPVLTTRPKRPSLAIKSDGEIVVAFQGSRR